MRRWQTDAELDQNIAAGYYKSSILAVSRPNSIAEMINHALGRVFDLFNIDFGAVRRWTRRLAWSRTGVNGASPISTAARRGG